MACPGRAFAASTIKLILSRLVCEYEMRFEGGDGDRDAVGKGKIGGGRPANVTDRENIFPNLKARVLLREVGS